MDFGITVHQGMLEKSDSGIETKTAIEWENERSEKEAGMTALSSSIIPAQPVLCFDAYGNLTAEKPPFQDAALLSPLSQSYDFSPNFKSSSLEEDDPFLKKYNAISDKVNLKRTKQSKKIRFSDTQLKQVIKEDLPDSISTSTSRYGRERKKRTSDGFLFGTINFNELRKVTACATTIPLSPKEKPSVENADGVNFESNPLSKHFDDEIAAPGLAPPEKILTSAESSSETEDLSSGSTIPVEKKKMKKVKKALVNSLPLTENKAVISPSPAKASQRKLKEEQRHSKLSSPSCKIAGNASKANDETPDSKKKKISESVIDKSFEKSKIDLDKSKLIEENGRLKHSPDSKNERPYSCKRISTFNSDEEVEVNFTPRKKKRRIPDTPPTTPSFGNSFLDSLMTGKIPPEDNLDACDSGEKIGHDFEDSMVVSNIDLGTVGDIADDLRLLKDLTEKNKSDLLNTPERSEKQQPSQSIAPVPNTPQVDTKDGSIEVPKRKRGRPRKSLPVFDPKKQKSMPTKSIAEEELAFETKSVNSATYGPSVDEIKTEMEGHDFEDTSFDLSNNSLLASPSSRSVSHTKRGRAVRKPNITDIADLNEMQLQAKKLLKYEKNVAASAVETSAECGPPAELLTELEENHPVEHSLGDVVWVALRGHPLWPAVIIEDTDLSMHSKLEVKQTVKGFLSHRVYHVLFLNDSLRVYWMREEYLLLFTGRADMKAHLDDIRNKFNSLKHSDKPFHCLLLKSLSHFHKDAEAIQASPKLARWSAAVDEAEFSTALPREERVQKYTELKKLSAGANSVNLKPKKRKKHKKKELIAAQEIKTEPLPLACDDSISRQASPISDMCRSRRSPSNESEFSGFDDSSSSEMQKKRRLELIRSYSKEDTFDVFYKVKVESFQKDYPKYSNTQLKKEMQQRWTKMGEIKRLQFLKTHLGSFGDSDDAFKDKYSSLDESSDPSEAITVETAATSKRGRKPAHEDCGDSTRGTYKLPRNEKVCFRCESVSCEPNGSDMVRCKGPCCGTYHYACLGLHVKPDNDKEFRCGECVSGLHQCFICKQSGRLASAKKELKLKNCSTEKSPFNGGSSEKGVKLEPVDGDQKLNTSEGKSSLQEKRRRKSNARKSVSMEDKQACKVDLEENEKTESIGNKCSREEKCDDENKTSSQSDPEADRKHENTEKSTFDQNIEKENVSKGCEANGESENSEKQQNTMKSASGDTTCEKEEEEEVGDSIKVEKDVVMEEVKEDVDESTELQRCSVACCGKFYHLQCALKWPQVSHGWNHAKKLVCPRHVCHMCAATAEDMTCPAARSGSFTRCLRCPATYHTGTDCLAAGSEEISLGSHVCPRHNPQAKSNHLNVTWCFGCSKGGSLVLCDECPAAYHLECLDVPPSPEEGKGFVCDDCINGKVPVYGDIVWAKLGAYRWWPGQVLHPRYIPDNIENLKHTQGMFCVHFFGSNDYYWVHRGRVFHYQDGDRGCKSYQKSSLNRQFEKALEETKVAFEEEQTNRSLRDAKRHEKGSNKPPPFVRIDTNKPVGNVKRQELELPPRCDCDLLSAAPCGPNSGCINRMLMIECAVEVCGARERCCNQRFQRRQYPQLAPQRVAGRGWGLHTQQDIKAGDFVIEYVGELVDETELWRRIDYMHQINEENYYFLTITKDIIIDAGPKGNLARFMNHSCEPNCETQKWQVGTETRVGLFALCDIPAGAEVTFNYHFECVGTEKKKCSCGSANCSGFIGAKVQKIEPAKKAVGYLKKKKKKKRGQITKVTDDECFRCGSPGDLILCDLTACPKGYHLGCLGLDTLPRGKWVCPWHHCDECGNRAATRCFMCPNSFCKAHAEGKMVTTPESAAGGSGGGSLTHCAEHSQQCVIDYCAFSKAQALRAQTEAVRAESPCCQEEASTAAGAAAGAAAPRLQRVQQQQQQTEAAAARRCKERSERARARRQIRELYNLSELYSEYGAGSLDAMSPEKLLRSSWRRDSSDSDVERGRSNGPGRKGISEREGDMEDSETNLWFNEAKSGTRKRCSNSNSSSSEQCESDVLATECDKECELEASPVINVVVNLKPRRLSNNPLVVNSQRPCSEGQSDSLTGGPICDQSTIFKPIGSSCGDRSAGSNITGVNIPKCESIVNVQTPINSSSEKLVNVKVKNISGLSKICENGKSITSDQSRSNMSNSTLLNSNKTQIKASSSCRLRPDRYKKYNDNVSMLENWSKDTAVSNSSRNSEESRKGNSTALLLNSSNIPAEKAGCKNGVRFQHQAANDCNVTTEEIISKSSRNEFRFDEQPTNSSDIFQRSCMSSDGKSSPINDKNLNVEDLTLLERKRRVAREKSSASVGRNRRLSLKRRRASKEYVSVSKDCGYSADSDDNDLQVSTIRLPSTKREFDWSSKNSINRGLHYGSKTNLKETEVKFSIGRHVDVSPSLHKSPNLDLSSVNERRPRSCELEDKDSDDEVLVLTVPTISIAM